MKEKIEELKGIIEDIETIIFYLEGGFSKKNMRIDGTVKNELCCYRDKGKDLQSTIDEFMEKHGSEMLPTDDEEA